MEVDLRGDENDYPMEELGCIEDHCIHWYHQSVWNDFASIDTCMEVGSKNTTFTEKFGGINISVDVPSEVNDELTGLTLDHAQVVEGMRTEVRQLETLKVGKNMTESEARKLASERGVKDFNFTLGEHTKDTHSCTLPLSCEGFRLWSGKRISIRDLRSHLVTGFIALCLSLSFVVGSLVDHVRCFYCFHVC